jgi:hypothetical protein
VRRFPVRSSASSTVTLRILTQPCQSGREAYSTISALAALHNSFLGTQFRHGSEAGRAFDGPTGDRPGAQWFARWPLLGYADAHSRGNRERWPFPARARNWHQISNEGGHGPLWAKNGKQLFYRRGNQVWAVDVQAGADFTAGKAHLLLSSPAMPLPIQSAGGIPTAGGL